MLRLLLTFMLPFSFSTSLAVPTPVAKAKPFKVDLILKTVDGRALQHGYKAGLELQTGKSTTLSVKDWNGVELVAGDVISLISHDETVQAERLAGSQKLVWQTTQTKPQTRFVLRKIEGAEGSPIATGDRVRLQLFGDKDSYLSSNAELVHVTTPGPDQTWLVRRQTFGNQAARNLCSEAFQCSFGELAKSKALYEEAFKLGAVDAAGEIADMYLAGKFGSKDLVQAAAYYRKGAEAGVPASMFMYGVLLYRGGGVSENKREAVRWEQMASQADFYPATDKLKEWGEPLPGVAASAVPKPPTPDPAFWQPKWQVGTSFRNSKGMVYGLITKVDPSNKRYFLSTRTWVEPPNPDFLTGVECGHFNLVEYWVSDKFEGATNDKYRVCDQCDGEAQQFVEGGRSRGGEWESVGYNVRVYTRQRVPLSYTKVVRCRGCNGDGWIKR